MTRKSYQLVGAPLSVCSDCGRRTWRKITPYHWECVNCRNELWTTVWLQV